MKKTLALFTLMLSFTAFSQSNTDQYTLEAGYGLGVSGKPGITDFAHYNVAFRYMIDDYWGFKLDYGSDTFRTDTNPEMGVDYNRFSAQAVYNLGRTLNLTNYSDTWFNVLVHGGLGYSNLKSVVTGRTDNAGNVMLGVTPQFKITDQFALHLDAAYIVNISQHYDYDGTSHNVKAAESFIGSQFNLSFGLTFYFGRNGNRADWR